MQRVAQCAKTKKAVVRLAPFLCKAPPLVLVRPVSCLRASHSFLLFLCGKKRTEENALPRGRGGLPTSEADLALPVDQQYELYHGDPGTFRLCRPS